MPVDRKLSLHSAPGPSFFLHADRRNFLSLLDVSSCKERSRMCLRQSVNN